MRSVRSEVDYVLPVTIVRRSHEPCYKNGTLVKCVWENDVHLYDTLDDEDSWRLSDEHKLKMRDAGAGVVSGTAYHVGNLELRKARLDPVYSSTRTKHHLLDVSQDLYYYVAFRKGLFWARFDWLELVDATTKK